MPNIRSPSSKYPSPNAQSSTQEVAGMADRDAPDAGLLIDGTCVPAASGACTPVRNPATGAVLAHVAQAGIEDVHAAIEAMVCRRQGRRAPAWLIRAGALQRAEKRVYC